MQAIPVEGTMPNFHTLLKNSKHPISTKLRSETSSLAILTPARTLESEPRSLTAVELFSTIVPRCFATPSCSPLWNAGFYHRAAGKESINTHTCQSHMEEPVIRSSLRHPFTQPFRLPPFHQSLIPHSVDLVNRRASPLVVSSAHISNFGSADGEGGAFQNGKGDKSGRSEHSLRSAFAFHFFNPPGGNVSAVREMASLAFREDKDDVQLPQPGAVYADTARADVAARAVGAENHMPGVDAGSLRWTAGAAAIPHPAKVDKGGEDAHFISSEMCAIGVADGVGAWEFVQVDSGIYARQLMQHSLEALEEEPEGCVDPRKCLKLAHQQTKVRGSSTACLVVLADNVFSIPVAAGDVVVLGTDGVFDNLYDAEVTGVVVHCTRSGWGPQSAAVKIATLAKIRSEDKMRMTPFARGARDEGFRYWGGKMDDITVVVTYITESTQTKTKYKL